MRKGAFSAMINVFVAAGVMYLAVVAYMYVSQRKMMYFPGDPRPTIATSQVPEMSEVNFTTEDGLDLFAWVSPPSDPDKPTVVIFHGNAGTLADRDHKARHFLDAGFGVMLAEYRVYSENPGSLSEEGLYADARAALGYLRDQGLKPKDIVLYGESLGTGVVTKMAHEFEQKGLGTIAALVLEAPFTSTVDVGANIYPFLPVRLLMKDQYDSLSRIGAITAPIFVVHGEQDRTVPIKFGRQLFEAAHEPKQSLWIVQAQHNDLYDFGVGEAVVEFLNNHTR
ncbi:MAG: alpha/beta hydrolase [Magnetovibrio sp.]|nr:alpha/beta hydrolase [Magnetovibrio sp.]